MIEGSVQSVVGHCRTKELKDQLGFSVKYLNKIGRCSAENKQPIKNRLKGMPIPQICFFKMFLHQKIMLFQELLVIIMFFTIYITF